MNLQGKTCSISKDKRRVESSYSGKRKLQTNKDNMKVVNSAQQHLILETVTCEKMESLQFDICDTSSNDSISFVPETDKHTTFVVDELHFKSNEDQDNNNSYDSDKYDSSDNSEGSCVEEVCQPEGRLGRQKVAVEFLHISDSLIIILPKNSTLYFYGLMSAQVLHGAVDVLGYTLTQSSEAQELYSPRGSAFLYLTNTNYNEQVNKSFIQETLLKENFVSQEVNTLVDKIESTSAVILCKKMSSPKINFLVRHIAQQIFPNIDNVQCSFNVEHENSNLLKFNPELDSIISRMHKKSKTLLSGGKGVGKSSALRYMVNKLLLSYKEVLVIDLDPGQPEFTISGCLSATIVTEPVFGPNYTHLREPYRSVFVPKIDISAQPRDYIKNVKLLMSLCEHIPSMPTIVNYMGYTRGFGLNIFSSVVCCVKPSSVIEIRSSNPNRNFAQCLSLDLIHKSAQILTRHSEELSNLEIITIPSMTDESNGWVLEPRKVREMCVLSYFGACLPHSQKYITDATNHLYKVYFSEVNLICDDNIVAPAVVNANLVAMCKPSSIHGSYLCYGYGIVRAVDYETRELYIITPITRDYLELVNSLILGSVALPPSMYMASDRVEGIVPYVSKGILPVFGKLSKRSHLPKEHF
ncbi:hypothetical protein PPYR_05745 [Photinus pyralis]|uniref:Polynucleotide 5'-hydroxyl-kinase NOL9 n=1 Tax=Photinus pyralis TaxID=7054 RepID=A0A1Y1KG92_PHOPY|nr:polynucleotide 5'-hydroxyl-kinase NOL9 [Photinus pyralis]KAB0801391.1 hypothetical protein PPYR_05745 [Photinus pyralis]